MMLLAELPAWQANLIIGINIVALMGFASFACVRANLSPLWVLLLLVPIVNVAAIWLAAYAKWPADSLSKDTSSND